MDNPLAVLNNLHIAEPCPASWEQMTGDAHARHCVQCDLKVFDLSSMPAAAAAKLVADARGERLCVRYRQRDDGTVITADPPRIDRRTMFGRLAALAASAFGIASLSGCGGAPDPVVGKIAPKPVTGALVPPDARAVMGELPAVQGDVHMGGISAPKPDANKAPPPAPEERPLMGKVLAPAPKPAAPKP